MLGKVAPVALFGKVKWIYLPLFALQNVSNDGVAEAKTIGAEDIEDL